MKRLFLACGALVLAACSSEPAAPPVLYLTCEAFPADMSGETLARLHGEAALSEEVVSGPEGAQTRVTVLYAADPAKRLEIVWSDPARRSGFVSANTAGESSEWIGPAGIRVGQAMTNVQRANGGPFKLWGFDWDYGGWVSDWNGGAIAQSADGCVTTVRFQPTVTPYEKVMGDSEFASDDADMRAAIPRVQEFGIRR